MRTPDEMVEAIAYWKRVLTDAEKDPRYAGVAGDPSSLVALVKGIIWALEWANGRDSVSIINEATNEEWIKKWMP